jgi:site-specific DNA recombinase
VHGFFAERVFGPARRELLAAQLASRAPSPEPDRTAGRAGMLRQAISDIERRKHALIAELETQPCGGDSGGDDPDAARQYRQAIQRRFTELVAEHRGKTGELAQLAAHQSHPGPPDPGLLAALPQVPLRLAGLPEHLQRSLFDAFQLQVRYHRPRHEVTIRVTIRADSLDHIKGTVNAIKPQRAAEKKTETGSHVPSAPSRIRTCAHGSGGRSSIP